MPGGFGRPPSPRLGRGEIFQAVCQDTQRLSERGDTALESEHALVQGGRRLPVTPAGCMFMRPLPVDHAAASDAAGCLFLILQGHHDGTRPGGAERPLPVPNGPYRCRG